MILSPLKPSIHIRWRVVTAAFILLLTVISILGYMFWLAILKGLPSAEALGQRNIALTSRIYDRNGELLYKFYKDENRTLVKLEDVPLYVRYATIAAEDRDFYTHHGFSLKGITRATVDYLKERKISGGSTITQQLVKNALLSPEQTLTRKIKEIIIATNVEKKFSKDQILEMYLNEVSYGGTAFGIQEASRLYFAKDVDKLNLAEAALLAGLPKSPTSLSPFGTAPELANERKNHILDLMVENNFISKDQGAKAKEKPINFAPNTIEMKAPHFVMYVREILAQKYGEDYLEKGGLEVKTTLDTNIQKLAEKAVSEELKKISYLNVTNAAALVVKVKTGEILAMVGSKDYFDQENGGNVNVLLRPRQPGSSIKVINYAYALANGLTPATILNDEPAIFNIDGQPPYIPKNYDGKYRGKITLRSALAESRNIPAVKVLNTIGVKNMLKLGRQMGITTWNDDSRFGLSLTLGGGDVKMIDLAKVYSTIANYGQQADTISISEISDSSGKNIYKNDCTEKCASKKVLDPRVAFILTDILKDNSARSPAFGSHSALTIPKHPEVAVKTGTSNNLRDNVTIGYNQDYLVAVWVGNNNNSEMARIASGITGAAPIWNKIMQGILGDSESLAWTSPEGVKIVDICPLTGTLPCGGCPTKGEWFFEENTPKNHCTNDMLAKEENKITRNSREFREQFWQALE